MTPLLLRLIVVVIGITTLCSSQITHVEETNTWAERLGGPALPFSDQSTANQISTWAQASEWLGPLAPIAISPFFGITCLAAISQFGGDWVAFNRFLSTNPILNNPTIFWVFLGLTVVTSLPRFTKVSKPVAQAIDQLEAYAGIISILVIRFLPDLMAPSEMVPATAMVVQMGFISFSSNLLLSVAAVINIFVINSVKFFFEIMVWLIPVPMVDALLEVANKSACAGLMSIYAFSPTLATLLNLLLFGICLIIFRWINRRVGFLRSMIGDPVLVFFGPRFGVCRSDELTVFPQGSQFGFPAKSKLVLSAKEQGWQLKEHRFCRSPKIQSLDHELVKLTLREGLLVNSIEVGGNPAGRLLFSRRYRNQADELSRRLKIGRSSIECSQDLNSALTPG